METIKMFIALLAFPPMDKQAQVPHSPVLAPGLLRISSNSWMWRVFPLESQEWNSSINSSWLILSAQQKSSSGWWLTYPSKKYESQLGLVFPICGKLKNVPNHQLVILGLGWLFSIHKFWVIHRPPAAPAKRMFNSPSQRCPVSAGLYKSEEQKPPDHTAHVTRHHTKPTIDPKEHHFTAKGAIQHSKRQLTRPIFPSEPW